MSRSRLVLLVVLGALVWVWLSTPRMPGARGSLQTARPAPAAARPPVVFDLQVATERLESRLRALDGAPRLAVRNPFEFGSSARVSPVPRPAQAAIAPVALGGTNGDAVAAPPLTLIGVVDRTIEGRTVRVAVISMGDRLYYVSAGERLGARYETVAVSADAVELRDLTEGTTRRVGLR